MIQLTEKVFALPIPSMAFGIMINNYGNESELMYTLDIEEIDESNKTDETLIVKKLPPGNWEYLCTTNVATEEQASRVVMKEDHFAYWNYEGDFVDQVPSCKTALESLRSLLKSKNLTGNYAIILKK